MQNGKFLFDKNKGNNDILNSLNERKMYSYPDCPTFSYMRELHNTENKTKLSINDELYVIAINKYLLNLDKSEYQFNHYLGGR